MTTHKQRVKKGLRAHNEFEKGRQRRYIKNQAFEAEIISGPITFHVKSSVGKVNTFGKQRSLNIDGNNKLRSYI